jgi:hypothetical protein
MNRFTRGDVVCHKAAFLRSCGWYTNVPKNGIVTAVDNGLAPDRQILTVAWSDGETMKILSSNVILYNRRHLEPA